MVESIASPSERSLFERLGGYDAIAAVIGDLYDRMLSDPQLGNYWRGHSNDSKSTERKLIVDFVCMSTGGPNVYAGRDMETSHDGLGISEVDWEAFVRLAEATLQESGLPANERDELFSSMVSFKAVTTGSKQGEPRRDGRPEDGSLTRREREILRLVVLGKSNSEIARQLFISLNTVTRHMTNIFSKTGTANRVEAAVYGTRHGLT